MLARNLSLVSGEKEEGRARQLGKSGKGRLWQIKRTLIGEMNGVHNVSVDSDGRGDDGSDARPADLASEGVLPDSTVGENLVERFQLLDPEIKKEAKGKIEVSEKKGEAKGRRGDELDDVEEIGSRHGEVRADVVGDGKPSLLHLGLEDVWKTREKKKV